MNVSSLFTFLGTWMLIAWFLNAANMTKALQLELFAGPMVLTIWMLLWWLKETKIDDE